MKQLEQLKSQASAKHNLASALSHNIMAFEEGHIYDERKAFYAANREALNEAVEKLRADTAELTQKYGETAGKLHALEGITKITGAIGDLADAYELGSRIKQACQDGNWDPVAGMIAKIAATDATISGSAAIARMLGMALLGVSAPAGVLTALTIGTSVLLTFIAINTFIDSLDKELSTSGLLDFGSNTFPYSDLVVFGNHQYTGHVKLTADNITLIGRQQFQTLEIDSNTLTVIGNIDASAHLKINSPKIEIIDNRDILEKIMQQSEAGMPGSEAGQTSDSPPAAESTTGSGTAPQAAAHPPSDPDPQIDYAYLNAAAARFNMSPQDYLDSLIRTEIDWESLPDPRLADEIMERNARELDRIFGSPTLETPAPLPEEQPRYPDAFTNTVYPYDDAGNVWA
ncbi:hypothetical protein [Neisseria leonii]|uniref:hypothetical protein n=1 Tax=Neisseria leonii TaxID=2995413 RepID=UPI00237AF499|nr:hypothetical protein [Neisseria sp. 3986]MDD9326292.1 hypothetical protein [Neisseria sp. 3986]